MSATIHYQEGYKYQLVETYKIKTDLHPPETVRHPLFSIQKNGMITIKAGYAWDGASGPAIDTRNFMRGSLVHDIGCQAVNEGLLPKHFRPKFDKLLRKICREDGMSWIRAWYVYRAVLWFGKVTAKIGVPHPVLSAP